MAEEDYNEYFKERLKKLQKIESLYINPYPQDNLTTKSMSADILKKYASISEEGSKDLVIIAGRLMTIRRMGKIAFSHLLDDAGKIQVVFQKDLLKDFDLLDLIETGDIISVKGHPFKTSRGELSVRVSEFKLLAKALRQLPEKFHGLKDDDIRLRKRYLDLIMDPEVKKFFVNKTRLIKEIRNFMDKNGFLEVQTPILQEVYGGASAEPFTTHYNTLDCDFYLRISTELHLKRLIVGGFEKIYEIGPVFRNEGMDASHLQEIPNHFEFYWAYQDYKGLMKYTEEMIASVLKNTIGTLKIKYGDKEINFTPPYPVITFKDLILKQTGIDIDKFKDYESLKAEIKKRNIKDVKVDSAKHYGALLDEFYKRACRPSIIQPTFLIQYPTEMIPLAKRNEKDPSKINSVQLLVDGWELVKAYDELNNPIDQKLRFIEQQEFLKEGDKEAHPYDKDFVEALEYGMPPTAGFGLGIDRFCALVFDRQNIRETLFFPTMKPESLIKKDEEK
ncbi:Aspartate--tRNA(Asp/Asn) ligase [Candidatus Tiddalikarchaeum anstoanum]|nr:Aspartate--tRNA(Asp/Asn) ligase [Candidatus Tiddalikarchaeum anstoanum]